ncbi:Somatomedin-B and thrombospondin type-1 domain-containing protein [Acipenser ruthenus]|uniref:Somatomedin-B and thrombospondin type-1 domain-containing protein n=1 Tax=Acipenser ruthenus TaxID=7906 RepID=A0A662YJD2_ACIRT|nr:Somatomedin-B and thrombospondin type-1 domain-containing protein [Acipenser ruthenus]
MVVIFYFITTAMKFVGSTFLLVCVGLFLLASRSEGGCVDSGLCCAGRDHTCVSEGWRPDRSHGSCYCDQACAATLDCCHDYRQFCPAVSCEVSEWSAWSGCAEPCKATFRVRRRQVVREPQNGGAPCPHVQEYAGCAEYWSRRREECRQSFVPALITTGGYGNARRKRDVSTEQELSGYCVEFQLMFLTPGCLHTSGSHTRWMQYLREGHTVCVECQPPALGSGHQQCYGDGQDAKKNQFLQWQAVGAPRCRGTWKRIRRLASCTCPTVHSFLFI